MKKPLKILAWTVGSLIGLIVLALVVVTLSFDPNRYKDDIIQAVKAATGRELKIDGQLSWTLFPWLGVKAEGLTLGNAPGFGPEPFAKVGSAGVSVELLPLLRARVNVDRLHVRDLVVHLAHDAKGRSNWQDLSAPKAAGKPAPETKPETRPAGGGLPAGGLVIGGVDIQRATLTYRDAAQGASYAVRDLELQTDRLTLGAPVNLRLACTLEHGKPAKQTKLTLRTALSFSDKAVALRDLDLKLDDSHLTGAIEIVDLEKSALRFDLALDQIDADRYLDTAPAKKASGSPGAATTPAAAPAAIPVSTLRTLDAQGKLRIGKLKVFGIHSSDIAIRLSAKNGVLAFGPNSAKLYGGGYAGRTTVDARPAKPLLTMDEQLNGVQLGPLLKDADLFDRFSGTGEVVLKLTAQGLDAQQLKQTLNGNARVDLRDGKIEGVNLQKLVADARQLYDSARGKSVAVKPATSDETAFKSLHASARITNGVARTDDLKLEGPVVRGEGTGSADLTRETLDYRLRVTVAEAADRKGTTVPVRIGGSFAEPSYGVEFEEILKQEAGRKLEKELQKGLDKQLDRLFRKKD